MKNFFKGRLSGKSTAAIICFCLAAVAALGIFSYNKASEELAGELSGVKDGTSQTLPVTETEPAEKANIPADNIPMEPSEQAAAEETMILEQDAFGMENDTAPEARPVSESFSGATVRPVSGDILSDFSDGELVKSKTLSVWKTHDGIDIAAETGSAVKSAAAGVVTSVSRDPLMGVTVIIDHGSGYEGYYCNLAYEVPVSEGEKVSAGTVIGEVGSTAEAEISEEPHLHFGLKKNGSWTDPADMLSGEGS
ncbi:MAG: M23 family metallopeptidase [Oscillospiraceae bacterium]|nr:M23 family metallopeptidase [Oscillospiraceae bacterium]